MPSRVTNPFGPITDSRRSPVSRLMGVLRNPLFLWILVFGANTLAISLLLFHWTWVPSWIPWDSLYVWHPVVLSGVLCLNLWSFPRLRA